MADFVLFPGRHLWHEVSPRPVAHAIVGGTGQVTWCGQGTRSGDDLRAEPAGRVCSNCVKVKAKSERDG